MIQPFPASAAQFAQGSRAWRAKNKKAQIVPGRKAAELIELAMSQPPERVGNRTLGGLKPHSDESVKVSENPKFEMKGRDVVGLCADPPDRAVIAPADMKRQIQTLGRARTPLPMNFPAISRPAPLTASAIALPA